MIEKILKFISKLIGGALITLSVTLFLFSFFISYNIEGIDNLKEPLQEFLTSNILLNGLAEQQGIDLEQIKEYCALAPEDPNCNLLLKPEKLVEENPQFNELVEKVKGYNIYANYGKIGAVILFLLGFLFIYLGTLDFKASLFRVSFNSTVTSGLAIFYYRFFPDLINSIIPNLTTQLQPEILSNLTKIVLNWLIIPINKVTVLAATLTIIFLVLTISLFILKKKDLKEAEAVKGKKNDKK